MKKILIIILIIIPLASFAADLTVMVQVTNHRNSLPDDTPHFISVIGFYKNFKDCEDDLIAEFVKTPETYGYKKGAKLENWGGAAWVWYKDFEEDHAYIQNGLKEKKMKLRKFQRYCVVHKNLLQSSNGNQGTIWLN